MARLELASFREEHLRPSAHLLAARHERHRATEPLLPAVADFVTQIEGDWSRAGASGAVALADGQVVGYVIGLAGEDDARGRHVHVGAAGHAAADAELVRDLYAVAAAEWVDAGHARHTVVVPASDAGLVEAWFRLGFGQQQAFAVRETAGARAGGARVPIRLGALADLDRTLPLLPAIGDHQGRSPVFSGVAPPSEEQLRADWEAFLAEPGVVYFVAERDGRPVGHAVVAPAEAPDSKYRRGDLMTPRGAAELAIAATAPDVRGSGAGLALTDAALAWAREQGYETIVTDWRVTNLLSSRFWPRRGFRPTFLRLYRSIP